MRTRSMWNKKKYQREINKMVRFVNKTLNKDWLWQDRFYVHQNFFCAIPYADHSGMMVHYILEIKDNKTGRIEQQSFDTFDTIYDIFRWINDCIIQYWNIWSEDPNPYEVAKIEGRHPQ